MTSAKRLLKSSRCGYHSMLQSSAIGPEFRRVAVLFWEQALVLTFRPNSMEAVRSTYCYFYRIYYSLSRLTISVVLTVETSLRFLFAATPIFVYKFSFTDCRQKLTWICVSLWSENNNIHKTLLCSCRTTYANADRIRTMQTCASDTTMKVNTHIQWRLKMERERAFGAMACDAANIDDNDKWMHSHFLAHYNKSFNIRFSRCLHHKHRMHDRERGFTGHTHHSLALLMSRVFLFPHTETRHDRRMFARLFFVFIFICMCSVFSFSNWKLQ